MGGGSLLLASLSAGCAAWPTLCGGLRGILSVSSFALVQLLYHTALMALACRLAAWLGTRKALIVGTVGLFVYYAIIAPMILLPAARAWLPSAMAAAAALAPGCLNTDGSSSCAAPADALPLPLLSTVWRMDPLTAGPGLGASAHSSMGGAADVEVDLLPALMRAISTS